VRVLGQELRGDVAAAAAEERDEAGREEVSAALGGVPGGEHELADPQEVRRDVVHVLVDDGDSSALGLPQSVDKLGGNGGVAGEVMVAKVLGKLKGRKVAGMEPKIVKGRGAVEGGVVVAHKDQRGVDGAGPSQAVAHGGDGHREQVVSHFLAGVRIGPDVVRGDGLAVQPVFEVEDLTADGEPALALAQELFGGEDVLTRAHNGREQADEEDDDEAHEEDDDAQGDLFPPRHLHVLPGHAATAQARRRDPPRQEPRATDPLPALRALLRFINFLVVVVRVLRRLRRGGGGCRGLLRNVRAGRAGLAVHADDQVALLVIPVDEIVGILPVAARGSRPTCSTAPPNRVQPRPARGLARRRRPAVEMPGDGGATPRGAAGERRNEPVSARATATASAHVILGERDIIRRRGGRPAAGKCARPPPTPPQIPNEVHALVSFCSQWRTAQEERDLPATARLVLRRRHGNPHRHQVPLIPLSGRDVRAFQRLCAEPPHRPAAAATAAFGPSRKRKSSALRHTKAAF
ncbi:MAG: hypothetical protein BJ554DRAFT_5841, partial [Olpidium bornovanus]